MDDDFPRLSTHLRSYVITRNLPTKEILLGGLGAMGVGEMWFDEEPHDSSRPGYAEAKITHHTERQGWR